MSIHSPPEQAPDLGQTLAALDDGTLTSRALVEAHIAHIERHDGRVGALVYRRFDEALAEADAADAARKAGTAGPLAGVPITVKDNFLMRGTPTTLGLEGRRAHRATEDAVMVEALKRAGAVVLGKTNVPQLLLSQETDNRLFGRTGNPWHLDRTPGGSSGGEAAAVAAGMSLFGLGSDIGGSIRIPCHFSGLAGLKPTLDRWSNRGMVGAVPGQELVRAQCGLLTRTVGDLIRLWQTLDPIWMASRDPFVAPVPSGDPNAIDLTGLRIGWYVSDGYLAPTPAIARAVERARAALEAAGATLVPYTPADRGEVLYLWLAAISSDGAATYGRVLDGEPFPQVLEPSRKLMMLPEAGRRAIAAVAERLGEPRLGRLVRTLGRKPVETYWDLVAERTRLRRAEFDAWSAAGIDAVIGPPHTVPAMAHGESADYVLGLANMFRWSLLNVPAGVVPSARVTEADLAMPPRRGDRLERKQAAIDAGALGLPVGVQVAARPYAEPVALAVMAAIEADAATHDDYPRTPIDPMP